MLRLCHESTNGKLGELFKSKPDFIKAFIIHFLASTFFFGMRVRNGLLSNNGLMYGVEDPSIAGMVLDSPFSDLVDLMMKLVDTYKVRKVCNPIHAKRNSKAFGLH
ncbi:hypothetical protein Ahy_A04g019500 isoform A [Arachis hypogaea]|uniref:Uncharacterized protein n=1 Tax=Arachis hypogaea TaxID=3818 RepID=A0A445DG25_ARAHY|nr:hypothetical protein Ahy_A04g019500 isoform A [Arachis hypogaea]